MKDLIELEGHWIIPKIKKSNKIDVESDGIKVLIYPRSAILKLVGDEITKKDQELSYTLRKRYPHDLSLGDIMLLFGYSSALSLGAWLAYMLRK